MSIKSKHSTTKNDRGGKKGKRKKSEDSEDMESSEEELDLTKECHPIGHYVNDRAEMINQMFSVIKGNKLKAMLPPILKDCDLDLLKLQCLDQLLGMSEKRIACVLAGEVLETSSESEVESNEYDSDDKNRTSSCSSSNGSEETVDDEFQNELEKKQKKRKRKRNSVDEGKSGKVLRNDADPPAAEQGKTLLEILELEMRARAIRALLKQNETGQETNNAEIKTCESKENGIKEISDEVVDLTGCEDDDIPVVVKKENVEESLIDEKVSTFEEKIEKSQGEKVHQSQEGEKAKRLQAELELHNKLFKKKIYRTRQQRMENEEEDKISVKQEPCEPEEFVIEDPEEGEVSSSEEEVPVEIKQEVVEPETAKEPPHVDECNGFNSLLETNSEKVTVTDNENSGTVGKPENGVNKQPVNDAKEANNSKGETEDDTSDSRECLNLESEDDLLNIENQDGGGSVHEESESFRIDEETSWRERWLRKDGVQKLVKSSKIYAKVKKRIAEKSHRSKEEVNAPTDSKSDSQNTLKLEVIEGSIKEYEKLVGKTVPTPAVSVTTEVSPQNNCNDVSETVDNSKIVTNTAHI